MVTKERLSLHTVAGRRVGTSGDKAYNIVIGVLMAVALGIGGYALKKMEQVSGLEKDIALLTFKVDELSKESGVDAKQNDSLSKHWVLHGWAKDELTQLRAEHGLGLARWPDFN